MYLYDGDSTKLLLSSGGFDPATGAVEPAPKDTGLSGALMLRRLRELLEYVAAESGSTLRLNSSRDA